MCQRKQDITQIEFLDYCKDGILDLVKKTYNDYNDKRKLLKSIDDDKKNCLHLVSLLKKFHILSLFASIIM